MAHNHRHVMGGGRRGPVQCSINYGITQAISLTGPRPIDMRLTKALEPVLRARGMFQNGQEVSHRVEVLRGLDTLVKEWAQGVRLRKWVPPLAAGYVDGKLYPFGSYRLGVHHKGADIDVLCVVAMHINRSDFFKSFPLLLKLQPQVTHLRVIEEAYVPVIKMTFDRIEIDMTFARLALQDIPENLELRDDQLLINLNEKCVRSLNGCRVTDEILRLVPNPDVFRLALRAVKLWAKTHGIYSNVMGYFGGVSWSMLVARTCQLYPNAAAATIVQKFFLVFSKWAWPSPVYLRMPEVPINLGYPVWDPRLHPMDEFHRMPIITPCYPQQNSTFNCKSNSCYKIIMEELKRGLEITEEIFWGRAKWEKLFEAPNFFTKYKHYITLVASSDSVADQLKWYGQVESRIRNLISDMEVTGAIKVAQAWPNSFTHRGGKAVWIIGVEFQNGTQNIELSKEFSRFQESVKSMAIARGVYDAGMEVHPGYVRRKNLGQYLPSALLGRKEKTEDEADDAQNRRPFGDVNGPHPGPSRNMGVSTSTHPQNNSQGSSSTSQAPNAPALVAPAPNQGVQVQEGRPIHVITTSASRISRLRSTNAREQPRWPLRIMHEWIRPVTRSPGVGTGTRTGGGNRQ